MSRSAHFMGKRWAEGVRSKRVSLTHATLRPSGFSPPSWAQRSAAGLLAFAGCQTPHLLSLTPPTFSSRSNNYITMFITYLAFVFLALSAPSIAKPVVGNPVGVLPLCLHPLLRSSLTGELP